MPVVDAAFPSMRLLGGGAAFRAEMLTRKEFERLSAQHPTIALKLLMRISKLISRRLRLTSGQLVEHLA